VLVLALAIVDDIGAIGVIAIFYSDGLEPGWLVAAAALALLVSLFHRFHVTSPTPFVAAGLALWLAIFESGVHATIAGVVLGLLTPARPAQPELETTEIVDVLENRADLRADEVRVTATLIRGSVSACDRLIDVLHPWSSYVILPIFALANAGIPLSADAFSGPSAVFVGAAAGLVIGKPLGIVCFSWLAVRLGLARLPDGARWGHIVGIGATAGIGFTVSLFITGLAFDSVQLQDDAKTAILVASVIAASLGATILHVVATSDRRRRGS
jgi:NhaA family Na+:H+ antiporter